MAVAANVTTIIKLQGQDRASKHVNAVSRATDQLQRKLRRAARTSRDVMTVLGGAAAGAAGIVFATQKIADMAAETERLRAQMRAAFGPDGEQAALATARAIKGVAVEAVVRLNAALQLANVEGKLTIEQLQQIGDVATRAGKTGDDALNALAKAIETGSGRALKQVGIMINTERAVDAYAKTLGVTTTELTHAQKAQAILNAATEHAAVTAGTATEAYSALDHASADLSNAITELKLLFSTQSGIIAEAASLVAETVSVFARFEGTLRKLGEAVIRGVVLPLNMLGKTIGTVAAAMVQTAQGEFALASNTIVGGMTDVGKEAQKVTVALYEAGAAIKDGIEAPAKRAALATDLMGSAFAGVNDQMGRILSQFGKVDAALAKREAAAAQQRKAKRAAAAKAAAQAQARAEQETARVMAEIRGEAADKAIAEISRMEQADKDARARAVEDARLQFMMESEQTRKRLELADMEAAKARQVAAEKKAATMDTIGASIAGARMLAQSLISNEKALAPVLQAMIIAQGALAMLRAYSKPIPDVAGMIFAGATIASGLAGLAGLGSVGAGTAPPAPTTAGAAAGPAIPAQTGGGGGNTYVINVNGGLGTQAEVGAAVNKAVKAAMGTGK